MTQIAEQPMIERRTSVLPVSQWPEGVTAERRSGTSLFQQHQEVRVAASEARMPDGDQLQSIQNTVGDWLVGHGGPLEDYEHFTAERYTNPDMDAVEQNVMGLIDYMEANHPNAISHEEIQATQLFLQATRKFNEEKPTDGTIHPDADGSFAFVVPARMSRKNTEYGEEVETVMPALRYMPRHLRAAMMVGLPPFVIDTYQPNENGKRGYLVFAPVYPDMYDDVPGTEAIKIGRKLVDDAVDLAYNRLGANIIGLGAILPKITFYGKTITNPNVVTTTGHGGTIQLIMETVNRAHEEGRISPDAVRRIGVLGLGTIGESIAHITRDYYPDAIMTVFDAEPNKTAKVATDIVARAASSETEVIEDSDVIISALPDIKLNLRAMGLTAETMRGKLIVDDSQPAAFDPTDVESLGGSLAWVVGQDGDRMLRHDYRYGGTLAASNALFGCEAEAAALAARYDDFITEGLQPNTALEAVRDLSIRKAVRPEDVRQIGALFTRYNVTSAPLQAFGRYI